MKKSKYIYIETSEALSDTDNDKGGFALIGEDGTNFTFDAVSSGSLRIDSNKNNSNFNSLVISKQSAMELTLWLREVYFEEGG